MTRNPTGHAGRSDDCGTPGAERARRFVTRVTVDDQGRTYIPAPFDLDEVWGSKHRHHVTGSLDGCDLRGVIDRINDGQVLVLGPPWRVRRRGARGG